MLAATGLLMQGCATLSDEDIHRSFTKCMTDADAVCRSAGLNVDVSVTALQNAFASRDDAERELVAALKLGDPVRIAAAEGKLKNVREEVSAAQLQVSRIVLESTDCAVKLTAIKERVKTGAKAGGELGSKTERAVVDESEVLIRRFRKTDVSLDLLKKRWLVPVLSAGANASTSALPVKVTGPAK